MATSKHKVQVCSVSTRSSNFHFEFQCSCISSAGSYSRSYDHIIMQSWKHFAKCLVSLLHQHKLCRPVWVMHASVINYKPTLTWFLLIYSHKLSLNFCQGIMYLEKSEKKKRLRQVLSLKQKIIPRLDVSFEPFCLKEFAYFQISVLLKFSNLKPAFATPKAPVE